MTVPPIDPEPQPDESRPIADPRPGHGSGPVAPDDPDAPEELDEPVPLDPEEYR
ncbi:hypothetical protein ACFFS4_30550 [Kutzneria kofuensis]|uniref:Uncharacterized protein n=1 Tax=Kutzneria kofuensis TaxID=103725 RepID=A0A7W9NEQ5_9PSEU|nr:hypothetical protein [Kutzneria kofuensis]MBB5889193.1 hypothetical protein [Kutzneria kofuensis]